MTRPVCGLSRNTSSATHHNLSNLSTRPRLHAFVHIENHVHHNSGDTAQSGKQFAEPQVPCSLKQQRPYVRHTAVRRQFDRWRRSKAHSADRCVSGTVRVRAPSQQTCCRTCRHLRLLHSPCPCKMVWTHLGFGPVSFCARSGSASSSRSLRPRLACHIHGLHRGGRLKRELADQERDALPGLGRPTRGVVLG